MTPTPPLDRFVPTMSFGRAVAIAVTFLVLALPPFAAAQSPTIAPPDLETHSLKIKAPSPSHVSDELNQLLSRLILKQIPHQFEETKDWGDQSERWDGVKFHRDGLKIKTHRRKKMVNHGTWKKYSAELLDPDEEFSIEIKNMRETHDGRLAFDVVFGAHLKIAARQSKWVKGVQLYSLSARGHAHIRLKVSVELETQMDPTSFPPDLLFLPAVTDADLIMEDFRLDRISKAGGEFAQQVTHSVRSTLEEKIQKKRVKLVKKINAQLAKQKDNLRISLADAIKSKWTPVATPFLPPPVQQAISNH